MAKTSKWAIHQGGNWLVKSPSIQRLTNESVIFYPIKLSKPKVPLHAWCCQVKVTRTICTLLVTLCKSVYVFGKQFGNIIKIYKNVPSAGIVSSGVLFIPRIRKLWVRIFSQHYLNCEIIRKTPKSQQQENCYVSSSLYSKRNNM